VARPLLDARSMRRGVVLACISLSLVAFAFLGACGGAGSSSDAGPDGNAGSDAADGARPCTGTGAVCAAGGFACAEQFASEGCLEHVCCILAADAGPPYYDDAGTCPGECASPDDIACSNWYRSTTCVAGSLCCVAGPLGDAAAD